MHTKFRLLNLRFVDTPSEGGGAGAEAPKGSQDPGKQGDPAELGAAGRKALQAERARADQAERDAKEARAEVERIKASGMTEAQKAEARAQKLEAEMAEMKATSDRRAVAIEYRLDKEDAALLDLVNDPKAMDLLAKRFARQPKEVHQEEPRRRGNFAPREGHQPSNPAEAEERAAVRSLFGNG